MLLPIRKKRIMSMSNEFIHPSFQVHLLSGSLRVVGIIYWTLCSSLANALVSAQWLLRFHNFFFRGVDMEFCVALIRQYREWGHTKDGGESPCIQEGAHMNTIVPEVGGISSWGTRWHLGEGSDKVSTWKKLCVITKKRGIWEEWEALILHVFF